jgi:hypothetical protein
MNYAQELDALDGIFINFAGGIVVRHENENYDGEATEWVRISSQTAKGSQISLGSNPLHRYKGVFFVQIFVLPDSGSGRAAEIVDAITTLIRGKTISGITFKVPTSHKIGVKDGWYQVNVLTEFYRED